tara:strand:+ start:5231 stop:5461 length:231 start_codon:yes stop_codon:yes gene_type:complete
MKSSTVFDLITDDKHTYYNDKSLSENLTTSILMKEGKDILNYKLREEKSKYIEIISSKNGTKKAYSQSYDLIAYFN